MKFACWITAVSYTHLLEIGTNYKLSGWQMIKEENAKLLIDGKEVTNDYEFTADKENMEVQIEFTFDGSTLGGKQLVTFEELYDICLLYTSRSDKDFGIVSIIDSRVGENSNALYKSVIWESLPIKNRTSDINEVAEFYKKLAE